MQRHRRKAKTNKAKGVQGRATGGRDRDGGPSLMKAAIQPIMSHVVSVAPLLLKGDVAGLPSILQTCHTINTHDPTSTRM